MGNPVYIPLWVHMGLLSGPNMGHLWACQYGLERIGPIWFLYGRAVNIPHRAHMGLLSGPHTGPLWVAHMGLSVWDPYGSYKGLPIWASRIHPILGPYGLAIWALHMSFMGVPIWACYLVMV